MDVKTTIRVIIVPLLVLALAPFVMASGGKIQIRPVAQ